MRSGAKNASCTGSRADNLTNFQGRQFSLSESMTGKPADSVEVDERLRRVRLRDLRVAMPSLTLSESWGVGASSRHPVVIQAAGFARTTHPVALALEGSLTSSTSEQPGSFASRFGPLPWTAPPC